MRPGSKSAQFLLHAIALAAAFGLAISIFHATHTSRAQESAAPPRRFELGQAQAGNLYAVTISVKDPSQIQGQDAFRVVIRDAQGAIADKWLHSADLDFYLTIRARKSGPVVASVEAPTDTHIPALYTALRRIPESGASVANHGQPVGVIAAQPNGTWQSAQSFELGQTIYGSADERPYAPSPAEDAYTAMLEGFQWFKFTYRGSQPRLVYFVLNVTDRDVPLDVDIFTLNKNAQGLADLVPYKAGESRYRIEATQNYPGLYKFRTRIVKPGQTYYVRVDANHPAYQLRTYDYPVPPYTDPHQAVRTGMDFLIDMGDTWLSNEPRRGSVALRTTMAHSETHLCIACHPTQFSTRGYLTAVKNGYPPTQREALEFIMDRIYNNARPLYGEPDTNWVRVIYSARTVASRLPVITHLYEANVTHDPPRAGFDIPYANFLKIHYKDQKQMPGNETDGCEPDVSPFEIATQSWRTFDIIYRQTHDPKWLAERDQVERLALPYQPKNMIDLNWKIHFLATVNRQKYASQLDTLIKQLYSYETPAGMWPYPLDKTAKPSDFISYHAILALALAGRRPETDEHLARAVKACLHAQLPEGSWEGDPVYQGFNTPFRATQFAVMALSTLYPGSVHAKKWDAAYPPPPTRLATHNLPLLLTQLDQYWDLAPETVLRQIRKVLASSDQPLAREAAARALGHMADPGALPVLNKALGDPTKMVQVSAAYAIRMILSRRPNIPAEERDLLAASLRSPDARARWGATRLFNQHFKALTGDPKLLQALTADLNDRVPFVRFQAASGLWRWYYWQVDHPSTRNGILQALATRLSIEPDPLVRRGLHESVYDALDENTGYMAAWIRTASTQTDKDRIETGYEAVVHDQAQVLAGVLQKATPQGREAILNALWDFHVRHYALPQVKEGTVSIGLPAVLTKYVEGVPDLHVPGYEYPPYRETVNFRYDVHNGFFQTRVGNDSDLIHFFKSSGPQLEDALIECLQGPGVDDAMKMQVLKAGSVLSGAGDSRFALAALRLSLDPSLEVRKTVAYVYKDAQRGVLNIDAPGAPDPALVKTVVEILNQGNPDSQAVLLPLLAALPINSPWGNEPQVLAALRSSLERQPRPANYAEVLGAASGFAPLMADPRLRNQVFAGLSDPNPKVERATIRICLEHFLSNPQTSPRVAQAFAHMGSSARSILIEEVNDPKFMRRHLGVSGGAVSQDQAYFLGHNTFYKDPDFLANPTVRSTVMASLEDRDANVRAAALDLLRKVKGIEQQQDFRTALQELERDQNPRLKLIAQRVLGGKKLSEALADVEPGSVLDYSYFVAKVEPILATPGPDGKACVFCHASHVIFKLLPPNEEGAFSPQDSEQNYKYAMRVVDVNNPTHSLMLIKPTRPTDSAGNVADYLATHNGGQRWPGNESSWQYKTILDWIRGARLGTVQSVRQTGK
jgi:HEAT repeat protein